MLKMDFPPLPPLNRLSPQTIACALVMWCLTSVTALAAGDRLTLELTQANELPVVVASTTKMKPRAGDLLKLSSEFGDGYEFKIQSAKKLNHGSQVIRGLAASGARLAMVVSVDGHLQGSVHDGANTYRVVQEGQELVWYRADPSLARPVDQGGHRLRKFDKAQRPIDFEVGIDAAKRTVQKSLTEETIHYPTFQSGEATIDLLFYHEAGMEYPEDTAALATEIANIAMIDSEIDIRFNIVAQKPLQIDPALLQEEVLDQMFEREGPFSEIETDRALNGADLVVALRENIPANDDACGIAPVGVQFGRAYRDAYVTVVQWLPADKAVGGEYCTATTTAHELGHLLGSSHERRLAEEDEVQAYPYSFGHYGNGFHTIMSYGDEPEKRVFSNPNITCQNLRCGLPEDDPESADNARGFAQVRFMLAGYEGESLAPELIRDFRMIDKSCDRDDDTEGFRKGPAISNQSPHTIDIRGFSVLTASAERLDYSYEPGAVTLSPGYYLPPECKALDEESLFGTEYVESWFTFYDPTSDKLIESLHLMWDDSYEGAYARVNTTSSDKGAVEGHTARMVKVGEPLTLDFSPAEGHELAGVESSCGGTLQGTAFQVDSISSDCRIEPEFVSSVPPTTDPFLAVRLEEPVDGDVLSGTGNLRGFAVASEGIDRVEIWMNGEYKFDAPYGGTRDDVAASPDYEGIEGADLSGYSLAWSYTLFDIGMNTIEAIAYDSAGNSKTATSVFEVVKFHKNRIRDPDTVQLDQGGSCLVEGNEITILDALIEEQPYDITLKWKTGSQSLQINDIR